MKSFTKNKLKNRSNSSTLDQVWTIDFTLLENLTLLTIQDLTTRQILIHRLAIEKQSFSTQDVITTVDECIRNKQRPTMIHADMGGQFTSGLFKQYLNKQNIVLSTGNASGKEDLFKHHNQVHERFHRSLKSFIRTALQDHLSLKHKPRTLEKLLILEDDEIALIVNGAINQFNNLKSQSPAAFGASPNIMEAALVQYEQNNSPIPVLLAATGTEKANEIAELKAKALKEYAGDWLAFFVDWKQQAELRHQEAMQQAELSYQQAEVRHQEATQLALDNKEKVIQVVVEEKEKIAKQYQELQQYLITIKEQVNALEQERQEKAEQEKLLQERKLRRKARERKPARDAATYFEYEQAIEMVDKITKNPYVAAREKVCLTFLYISGARVSNCLNLSVYHLEQMLQGDNISITAVKTKQTEYLKVTVTKAIHALVLQRKEDFEILCQGKQGNDLVITPKGKKDAIYPENLDRKLNLVLRETSKVVKKNLKTHSFRIGMTTSLIEVGGIEVAQKIIGHSNISTTAVYDRSKYTEADIRKIINKAESFKREKRVPRNYVKKNKLE